jgi:signal transduction histidine kinase
MFIEVGQGVVGRAVVTRQPVAFSNIAYAIPDEARANLDSQRLALLEHLYTRYRAILAVPLVVKEEIYGGIVLYYSKPREFLEEEIGLAVAFSDQAALAIENARLFAEAQGKAALEERQRLARELHDSVSQALYGIALGTSTARTLLDRDPAQATAPLDYVLSLAHAGLADMRALIFELRPESLALEGLCVALTKQAESLRARHGMDVQVSLCDEPQVTPDVKEALYRIAQEALNNAVKHARASRLELRLEQRAEAIMLEVCDNGIGFDPSGSFPGHLGLHSMRERAERLGGTVEIESAPGRGARARVHIPVRPHIDVADRPNQTRVSV